MEHLPGYPAKRGHMSDPRLHPSYRGGRHYDCFACPIPSLEAPKMMLAFLQRSINSGGITFCFIKLTVFGEIIPFHIFNQRTHIPTKRWEKIISPNKKSTQYCYNIESDNKFQLECICLVPLQHIVLQVMCIILLADCIDPYFTCKQNYPEHIVVLKSNSKYLLK